MSRLIQRSIRTKEAAAIRISTRGQLAQLLRADEELIGRVADRPGDFYSQFQIPKANGELRTIRPPRRQLRTLQRCLLDTFYKRVSIPSCLHGGVPNRSIFSHARGHVGRAMVATLDIRKFFPSTSAAHLLPVVEALGFVEGAAEDVIALTMLDSELPQGAPTSCLLANLAFLEGDRLFIGLCGKRGFHYSRYVDDVAVSGAAGFKELRGPFIEFIERAGYQAAEDKICFVPSSRRQVVTGLVVNDKLRPTAEYIAELKHTIRLCLEIGAFSVAEAEGVAVSVLQAQLTGKVAHLRRADASVGEKLRGLLCGVNWSRQRPANGFDF